MKAHIASNVMKAVVLAMLCLPALRAFVVEYERSVHHEKSQR